MQAGLWTRKDDFYIKETHHMFADVIIRGYIEAFELKNQGVSSNVYGYVLSLLADLKRQVNFTDESVYLGVRETVDGLYVRPSVHTALPLVVLSRRKLCERLEDSVFIPSSTVKGLSIKLADSFNLLCDTRLSLLYRNIAEIILCGYQASLVTHKRFEAAMERIKQLASYQIVSGYRARWIDLQRFLESQGFSNIQRCIGMDAFDTVNTNTMCAGLQMNKVIFNFLRQEGWITDVSGRKFKFLKDQVESSDELSKHIVTLDEREMSLIETCILVASSSKSLDPVMKTVSSRPVAIVGSGEIMEE